MDVIVSEAIKDSQNLTDSKALDLSMCSLYFLPEEIGELTQLETIDLSFNKLRNLPDSFSKLVNLKTIYLGENEFISIPKVLFRLTNLEFIDISQNRIQEIPHSIEKLNKLRHLNFTNNCINNLPDELCSLESLEDLRLSKNSLRSLPKAISNLTGLKKIFLNENELDSLTSSFSKLKKLEFINLDRNKIKKIPERLVKIEKLEYFNINNNFIRIIPDLVLKNSDPKEILNFIESLSLSDEFDYLYEAKLVMVGRGFAGKTSLVRKLTIPNYKLEQELKSTKGIDIKRWEFESVVKNSKNYTLNVWDFAGQEKYDATHQFFITERSVYIFVTEARQESNYLDFDYWINVIQLLSKESPIIIVQNKIDQRSKKLPTLKYKEQYPFIVDFCDVSAVDGYEKTIAELKKTLEKAIKSLPHMGDKLPKSWVDIRKELESMDVDFIEYSNYLSICKSYGLNKIKADYLSKYFNDLGVIVHKTDVADLMNLVILNTDWAVDGAYAVLDSEVVIRNSGRFTEKDLKKIWKDPRYNTKRRELLKLMMSYDLCFKLENSYDYIVPELLNPNRPRNIDSIQEKNSLRFTIKYDFMPAGILSKFIVKIHELIVDNQFWKYGVVLKYDKTKARVTEDNISKRVDVIINGENKIELLALIRKEFENIHLTYHNLMVKEMIPCNCSLCSNELDKDRIFFHDYDVLRTHKNKERRYVVCDISSEDVSIVSLISGAIAHNTEDNGVKNFNYYFDESKTTVMKVKNQKAKNIINADVIKDCNFSLNNNEEILPQLVNNLLEGDSKTEILKAYDVIKKKDVGQEERVSSWNKIQQFLLVNAEAIGQGTVAGVLTELGKLVFIGAS